jgi:hypothetical protein
MQGTSGTNRRFHVLVSSLSPNRHIMSAPTHKQRRTSYGGTELHDISDLRLNIPATALTGGNLDTNA